MIPKRLKPLSIALSGVILGHTALASEGGYIGGSLGWNYMTPRLQGTLNPTGVGGNPIVDGTYFNRFYSGYEGRLFLGWDQPLEGTQFVWGGEVFGFFSNASTSQLIDTPGGTSFMNKVQQQGGGGLKAKIGWKMTEKTTLSLHLSAINSRFLVDHTITNNANAIPHSFYKNLWALAPGVGIKVNLDNRWSVGAEAYYAFYETFKTTFVDTAVGVPANWTYYAFRMNPNQLGLSIGVSYKLGELA